MKYSFRVIGVPRPGGSKKGFVNPRTGRVVIVEDCKKTKSWRDSVVAAVRETYTGQPLAGPIRLNVTFYLPRPKGHYGSGKNSLFIKSSAPRYPTVKPDRTKLLRSTEDALSKILWRDDTQIITGIVSKYYTCDMPGALIEVEEMDGVA